MLASYFLVFAALLLSPLSIFADDTVKVTLSPSTLISPPVSPNLVSFSIEVYDFVRWTDWYPNPPRTAWVNLMKQFMLTPGQDGPRYRIGGDSGDLTVYDIHPLPKLPSGEPLVHSLNSTELQSWKAALNAINSHAVIDLNFRRADNASWAVSYVKAIDQYLGWDLVVALEVGNEIDLYANNGIRAKNFTYQEAKKEFLFYTQEIAKAVPTMPKRIFQGMINIQWTWLIQHLTDYLADAADILFSISQHSYPIPSCEGEVVHIEEVLDDQYATSTANTIEQNKIISTLQARGIEFVIGEGSEAVCNGNGPMVLNTFATALWAIHEMFEVAHVGLKHFYYHSWGTQTETFSVLVYGNPSAPERFLVQPIYYGLRMFAMATSHNATMIQATASTSNPHIHTYATINSQHQLTLVAVHKDLSSSATNATVSITLPLSSSAAPPTATVIRLLAGGNATAEYGVTLGGQTYDGSDDGMPKGEWVEEMVEGTVVQGGAVYQVTLSPISALLMRVTLPQEVEVKASVQVE